MQGLGEKLCLCTHLWCEGEKDNSILLLSCCYPAVSKEEKRINNAGEEHQILYSKAHVLRLKQNLGVSECQVPLNEAHRHSSQNCSVSTTVQSYSLVNYSPHLNFQP